MQELADEAPVQRKLTEPQSIGIKKVAQGAAEEKRQRIARKYESILAEKDAEISRLKLEAAKLANLNSIDPLTNTLRKEKGKAIIADLLRINEEKNGAFPGGVMMFDIDHFKGVNDEHGHPTADGVLTGIAQLIQANLRGDDIVVARYGGEEFLVAVTGIEKDELPKLGNRIRAAAEATTINGIQVTLSGGIVPFQIGQTADEHIKMADDALLGVKQNTSQEGSARNGILMYEDNVDMKTVTPVRVNPQSYGNQQT